MSYIYVKQERNNVTQSPGKKFWLSGDIKQKIILSFISLIFGAFTAGVSFAYAFGVKETNLLGDIRSHENRISQIETDHTNNSAQPILRRDFDELCKKLDESRKRDIEWRQKTIESLIKLETDLVWIKDKLKGVSDK